MKKEVKLCTFITKSKQKSDSGRIYKKRKVNPKSKDIPIFKEYTLWCKKNKTDTFRK